MEDLDQHQSQFIDEEVQITDLDALDSPLYKRAARIMGVLKMGLRTRWIRYSFFSGLLLILLGALILQWPRPAPVNTVPKPYRVFLGGTSAQGLLFLQSNDFTLTAYSMTDWHPRWHISLPTASNLQAQGSLLICNFALPGQKTALEALNIHTGKVIWHDTFPGILTSSMQISRGQAIPSFVYDNQWLYAQGLHDTIYAIQAHSGQIGWTYQARDKEQNATSGINLSMPLLQVSDGVVEFISAEAVTHVLDAMTGREIISSARFSQTWPAFIIDGPMLYAIPTLSNHSVQGFHLPDGKHVWTYSLAKGVWMQNETEGVIYLGANEGNKLIALRGSDAHQLWSYQASDLKPVVTGSFFASAGVCYIFQQDANLIGIRVSDGQILWRSSITDLVGRVDPLTSMFINDGLLILQDQQQNTTLPTSVISASTGRLLWRHNGPIFYLPGRGMLYSMGNNGKLDAWRESDGQRLWSFDAPIGSNIAWIFPAIPSLLFLKDVAGQLYVLRTTDGRVLWRYP